MMNITIKLLKLLVVLVLVAGIVVMALLGMGSGGGLSGDPIIEVGLAGKEPTYNETDTLNYSDVMLNEIGIEMGLETTDTTTLKYYIYDLYRMACYTWWTVPYRGGFYLGDGNGGVEGIVDGKMKAYNERFYVRADNADDPYQYYGYEGKYRVVYEANPSILKSSAESSLAMAKQYVYMPDGNWQWDGTAATLSTSGGGGTFAAADLKYTTAAAVKSQRTADIAADNVKDYVNNPINDAVGQDTPDKNTYIIDILSMSDEGLSLTAKEVDGTIVYTATCIINVDLEEYLKYANYYTASTVSGIKGIKYTELSISFEVWESGYFRSYSCTEEWKGTHSMGTGFVRMNSTELYTYDKEQVLTFIKDKVAKVQAADKSGKTMLSAKLGGKNIF